MCFCTRLRFLFVQPAESGTQRQPAWLAGVLTSRFDRRIWRCSCHRVFPDNIVNVAYWCHYGALGFIWQKTVPCFLQFCGKRRYQFVTARQVPDIYIAADEVFADCGHLCLALYPDH